MQDQCVLVYPLKRGGFKAQRKALVLYMAWLSSDDEIHGASEQLVLKFNPQWRAQTGLRPIDISYETRPRPQG